jgi:HK97 family phage portal protein
MWPFRRAQPAETKSGKVSGILAQPFDRGWFTIFESFTGAFQQDVKIDLNQVLANHAIFACTGLIASDISKLRPRIIAQEQDIWVEAPAKGFEVVQKPNSFQNRIQFYENWVLSKLIRGNAYILKERDRKGNVVGLYVLCPDLVQPLVSDTGDVFYRLNRDNLADIEDTIVVPATEIIHDRFNCLFHPLIGLSPIFACGLSAQQSLNIQRNSTKLFGNMSRPSGILSAPGAISSDTAERLKTSWETNYGGDNIGRVAVLGDDLKWIPLSMTAEESQLIDQLKISAEIGCSTFHVPRYKVLGDTPPVSNVEALEQQYYSQCLQILIESIELTLEEGLEVPEGKGIDFDLDGLLRMDQATMVETLSNAVKGGIDTPNEARKRRNQKPLPGGDTIWLQQQQWPIEVLAERRSPPTDNSVPAVPQDQADKAIEGLKFMQPEKMFFHA